MDNDIHFCGLKADLSLDLATPARLNRCRWWLDNTLPRWQRDDVRAVLADALGVWRTVADVQVEEAQNADVADLLVRCVALDGAYGVLADCELPGPRIQHMRLDTNEQWTVFLGENVPNGLIDLNRVLRHESGHFWGMGHAPAGSPNLMAPVYSKSIWTPQAWEIQQMQAAYGPPRPSPTPPPAPPAPAEPFVIKIHGADWVEVNGQKILPAAKAPQQAPAA